MGSRIAIVVGLSVLVTVWPAPVAGAAPDGQRTLVLGLRRDDAGLARFAAAVSDPRSSRYRRHLDVPQISARFGASPGTRAAVLRALRRRGLPARVGATGAWVETAVPAGRAARMFPGSPGRISLPSDLRRHVTEVIGLDERVAVRPHARRGTFPEPGAEAIDRHARRAGSSVRDNTGTQAGCAAGRAAGVELGRVEIPAYTPNQYLRAYRYDALHRRGLRGQGERVAVIEIDGFRRADVLAFGRCFGMRVPPTRITRVGLRQDLAPGDETTLDLEMLTAAAPGLAEIQVMQTPGTLSTLLRAYERVLARPRARRASVISTSLGFCEPDFYGSVAYFRLFESVYRAVAAAGVSNVASAGDTGSTGCTLGDNTNALALTAVQYPASSPHVTGVGGTNLELDARNRIVDEIVWNDLPMQFAGGSGGYSLIFRRPAWQRGPGVGGYERIVPDVAMLADYVPGFAVYCTPCGPPPWQAYGGTSAAAPLLAGGVAIANQQARRVGQPRLGFLNPLIYRIARGPERTRVFRDVLRTNNDLGSGLPASAGGGGPAGCCRARRHFDAASGWGSIDLPAFSGAARAAADSR